MQVNSAGHIKPIKDIPAGECVLFQSYGVPRLGFIVTLDGTKCFILDPCSPGQSGEIYPAVLRTPTETLNENCLHFPDARLRPSFDLACIGRGNHGFGEASRALYLVEGAFVISAALTYESEYFDLATGKLWQGNLGRHLYTRRWAVEIPDGSGKYEALTTFEIETSQPPSAR